MLRKLLITVIETPTQQGGKNTPHSHTKRKTVGSSTTHGCLGDSDCGNKRKVALEERILRVENGVSITNTIVLPLLLS